ncbi:MAG: riboflavin synthase [Lachnospiraceae bacterium]|nr:riboflavin synthase [Lachnospiraceae bacterium]
MFTGLIEEIGKVKQIRMGAKSGTIYITAKHILKDANIGDSIAVNGVCLTATEISGELFAADVMAETFRRSSLKELRAGSYVNLERAMANNGRFGGHIVSGHIDGTGKISEISREENAIWYTLSADERILHYVVEKGSIAIDGISLTVAYVDHSCFKVSIIPHTASKTILQYKEQGSIVNLECDIIGKYVEKMLTGTMGESIYEDHFLRETSKKQSKGITMEFLAENGF